MLIDTHTFSFIEANAPDDNPLEHEILITGDIVKDNNKLKELARVIQEIKSIADIEYEDINIVHIDRTENISQEYIFNIPDNWEDYSWPEKIDEICEQLVGKENILNINNELYKTRIFIN